MAQWQTTGTIGGDLYAVDTTPEFTLGTIVTAEDTASTDLGSAEFIYVKGVASAAAASVVTFNAGDYTIALAVADAIGNIGACISALVADKYGWVQISGKAECKVAASFAADATVYLTSTAGTVDDAVVAGDMIYSSRSLSAIGTPGTGTAYVNLNRSFVQDA